jgi:hypothetical protein
VVLRVGRELVEDDERDGRPKSTRTAVKIAAVVADLVTNDGRIVSRMIALSLNIPKAVFLPAALSFLDFFIAR